MPPIPPSDCMNIIRRIKYLFFDRSFVVFLCVGVLNTIVGMGVSYTCYNGLGFSYGWSMFYDYLIGSIISYFLNKRFAFHYQGTDWRSIARFTLNIVVCFIIAIPVARPITAWLLRLCVEPLSQVGITLSNTLIDNVAILTGTILFTLVNYLGQRFFAFAKSDSASKE